MSRYIDVDALKDKMFNYYDCVNLNTRKDNYNGETLMNYEVADMIEDCIDNAPAADVQEVKHGKWVELVKIRKDGKARLVHWQCSLCGCFLGTNTANYCPNCGAKMDLEEEE